MIHKGMEGKKILVTTDNWFHAPDGKQYRAAFGTLVGIFTDSDVLKIKTNSRSTNWYAQVGRVLIAGCQVHYAVLTDECNTYDMVTDELNDGSVVKVSLDSRIYAADQK